MPHPCKILFYLLPPLLAMLVAMTVDFKTDLSAFILAGDDAVETLLVSEMQSGALSRRYLISVGFESGPPFTADFMLALQDRLQSLDGIVEVWSTERQNEWEPILSRLYGKFGGSLYSLNPERELAELFTEQGLARRAEFLKQALLSPQGAVVKRLALQDPLLLTLDAFRSVGGRMPEPAESIAHNRNLIVETAMSGLDAPRQSRIQADIDAAFEALLQNRLQTQAKAWQLEMTGVPVFAAATQQLIPGDIKQISVLSSIALIALFLWLFSSFGALLQVFTLLITVILTTVLVTGWIFGYAVLGTSGYPGFQQVSVYAGTGIVAALLLTRFVLPKLGSDSHRRALQVPLAACWASFCARFRPWLSIVLLALVGTSLFGLQSLRWLEDMQGLTPELNHLKENGKKIRSRMVNIEPGASF